jgi:hypothetical protein
MTFLLSISTPIVKEKRRKEVQTIQRNDFVTTDRSKQPGL